jgi:PAS domain S-box-containing protein
MGVILIAYERESEQTTLEQLLAARGHRVVKTANGLAALDAARREPPQLIVSDIVLPRMDGFALCRKWKQDERLQSVPFFFYTRRHDDPKYERFALELGAERFFARSVQPDALLGAVDDLVARSPRTSETTPVPKLDEAATQRERDRELHAQEQERLQKAHQQSLERAQQAALQAQSALQTQMADLEATNQRLAAGEARFRSLFEVNPMPMWIADQATQGFIAVNQAALTLYGYTRAEFLSLTAPELLRESPAGSTTAAPLAGIEAHKTKLGAPLDVATASRETDFDGRSAELVCAWPLGDRLVREQRLQDQTVLQAAIINGIADGCFALDANGRIVEVNDAYCRMSGFSRATLLKMNASELEQQDAGETTIRLQLGRNSDGGRHETKHRRQDGSLVDVELNVSRLQHPLIDSVVIIRDITQRRRELVAQRIAQRQMEFLLDLHRQAESFDEPAIIRRLIDQATEATHSPLAYFFFVSPLHQTMTLAAWRDRNQANATMAQAEPRSLSAAGQIASCVVSRQPALSNDLSWKSQSDGLPDLQRYLAVPLTVGDDIVAVIGVANREASYGEDDQRSLAAMAESVWRVLQSKRLHAQTLGSLQRADIAIQGMTESLLRMVESHDPYTAGSARRIAALAVALGREAGLDGERQHSLRVAALLHDIGNISVPAAILAKPAPLTTHETALMRTHVEEGCKLLADIDFGLPVAEIVFEHHERFDGSGYPRGLQGEEIMLEARILAIADTVEALCSPRPWRPAAGMNAAIDEINLRSGTLFDSHLVECCTRLIRQHGFVLPPA